MTPAYTSEHIIRAVELALNQHLATALQDVEDEWREIEHVDLAMVHSFEYGFNDPAVDRPMGDFPIIAFVGCPRIVDASDGANSSRIADATHELYLAWVIVATTQRAAQLMMWRYGDAILRVVTKRGGYSGFSPTTLVPRTDEGMATPFTRSLDSPLPDGWIAGASAIVPVRGTIIR